MINHLFNCSIPDGNGVARIEKILYYSTAHDAQPEEAKVQLARLDVLLPQDLAAGDQVHVEGWTGRSG